MSNLNPSNPLFANIIRSLRGSTPRALMMDQTDGGVNTAEQPLHNVWTDEHISGVAPQQGMDTDGTYWYLIFNSKLEKRDFTTGALITSNLSSLSGLPAGVDHSGDGFVDGGLLYVPIVDWDGATETATKQVIAIFNTSDLSLNTYFDVSAQTAFGGSGLTKSHSGTIYGVSFANDSTPLAQQTDVYEFNPSTGAYIATHTLSVASIGTQGILWDGESYLLSSYDTINNNNFIHQYDETLTYIDSLDPTGINTPSSDEIEGLAFWDGVWYVHKINTAIRAFNKASLYINPNTGAGVQFITQAEMPDEATIVMRMNPHTYTNFRAIFDNKDTANDWEAWIYATGEVAWRVSSAGRTGFNYAGGANVEHLFMFTWKKNGSNVDIKFGVDGSIDSTNTTAWVNKPTQGLWLGAGNASNTQADHTYSDVVVFNKELTAGEWTALAADFDDIYSTGTPVTGNISFEIDKPVFASTGSATLPQPSGSIAFDVNAPTFSGNASVTLPQPIGNIAYSIDAPIFAASGSASVPYPVGNVAFTVNAPLFSASGSATVPYPVGSISLTIDEPIFASSGSATLPQPTGSASITVSAPLFSATATVSGLSLPIIPANTITLQAASNTIKL